MSTKTYTLTFNAPGIAPLPQGVFFMIKSASAALNIRANRRDAQPVVFENVGAGLQFNGLAAGVKWTTLEVESAAIQTVEIVISDDAAVSFANVVTVSGGVTVSETPSGAAVDRVPVVTGAAQAALFAANAARKRMTVYSDPANTQTVYVRTSGGANAIGFVQPGMSIEIKGTYAADYAAGAAGQTLYLWEEL